MHIYIHTHTHIYIYFTAMKLCQFMQYLSKYALLSTSCVTHRMNNEVWTLKDY